MRMQTFSVLKRCRFKPLAGWAAAAARTRSDSATAAPLPSHQKERAVGDPRLLEFHPTWGPAEHPELRAAVCSDLRVLPDFCSEDEEAAFLAELEPVLKRMRYEFDHWDNAIHGYRETERSAWRDACEAALARVRAAAFPARARGAAPPLPHAHVLDLAPAGHIKPHVDAVRFCGEVIAGLCLNSSAVMRLVHTQHPRLALDALLPRRCLYIMRGVARYDFTHAVLANDESKWRGERLVKGRRISVIVRSRPPPAPREPPPPPPPPPPGASQQGPGPANTIDTLP